VYTLQKSDAFATGDIKAVSSGITEMHVHESPGYRVYFVRRNEQFVVLLCGGTKANQRSDIAKAKHIAVSNGNASRMRMQTYFLLPLAM
jgi:putative addiction module killer protein